MRNADIELGSHKISYDRPPFFIAEVSANHNGNLDRALEIVASAADNGADAIKLQTFTADTLSIDSKKADFFINDPKSIWNGWKLWDLYKEAETPWEWHEPIFKLARKRGMACISSAFDQSSVEFLLQLGVDAIKIASFELVHTPLLKSAAKSGLPVILSTGMAALKEIEEAVCVLKENNCIEYILLRCTSAYPAEEKDANTSSITDLRKRFGCHVGLSDHCLSPYSVYSAVALGATVIEKHLTISRADGGLDSEFSLEPSDLKETVEGSRLVWSSLGLVKYGAQEVEKTSLVERPSIYVSKKIAAGEKFTPENIRIIRPGFGLPPKEFDNLIGRRSAQNIDLATALSWEMVL